MSFVMYYVAKAMLDDLGEINLIEILLIVPMLIHVLLQALFEAMAAIGLVLGIGCTMTGAVCLILTAPYFRRISEVRNVRAANFGKLPGEFLWEMYQSGELNEYDYKIELLNNMRITRSQKGLTPIAPVRPPVPVEPPVQRSAAQKCLRGVLYVLLGIAAAIVSLVIAFAALSAMIWLGLYLM